MKKKVPARPTLSSFYQNETLLIQFITHTFYKAASIALSESHPYCKLIEKATFPFCGSCETGPLLKLHEYLIYHLLYFSQNKENEMESTEKLLLNATRKALEIAHYCKETILLLPEKGNIPPFEIEQKNLVSLFKTMHESLIKRLMHYKHSEKILLLLIKKQKLIDSFFESPNVASFFKNTFQGGKKEAMQLVVQKYSKRGFIPEQVKKWIAT